MNVTEKQKVCIIRFMQRYPDFGRGRLRYNGENKRKIDELWEKLSLSLNTAGYGPRKTAKEWAKTWRDWKSNTLKKVAKHKQYMMGTGGGSPKDLQLSATEDALIKFLTPDASGLKDISEGGFTDVMPSYDNNKTLSLSTSSHNINEKQDETEDIFLNDNSNDELLESYEVHSPIQQNKQHMESVSMLSSNTNVQNIRNIHVKQRKRSIEPNTKVKKYDETFALSLHNVKNVHQNKEQDSKTTCETTVSLDDTEKYITKRSEGAKKPRLMATAINLLEKKSTLSENIKQEMLDLKKEKLALKREEVNTFKAILQQLQNMNDNVTFLREDLCPQYLTTDVQESQEVEDEVQESCLSP